MDFKETQMSIAVVGMWHLGTVVAGCLASAGYRVVGFDLNPETIDRLCRGILPVNEPGLNALIEKGMNEGLLLFTSNQMDISQADVVWVAYDTSIDEDDRADTEFVFESVRTLFPHLKRGVVVIISSQLPVGSTARIEREFRNYFPSGNASFACIPENLRLGNAIEVFTNPDRVVVGVRSGKDREGIALLIRPFTENIIWMSVESAEMTKHAINAFLATSVVFTNELARICERYGADAMEVERGLKTDLRIGPYAYLRPGPAFAGGTLARDIQYLLSFAREKKILTPLIDGVVESNNLQKNWPRQMFTNLVGDLEGKKLAILGLTYKPETDTLRRSEAIEMGRWLNEQGANVTAFDPAVKELPDELRDVFRLCMSPKDALLGAEAVFIGTPWPEFKKLRAGDAARWMKRPAVVDPAGFLAEIFENNSQIIYRVVGRPYETQR